MKKLLLTTALIAIATPAFAADYVVKEVTDYDNSEKPYYFEPDNLTIQPGDTVTFVNAQEDTHDVMFDVVPKALTEAMIMGPMMEKEGEKWSYTFTVPGTYHFHCHPHEANGMQGNLIVGQASAPGETKTVSHEDMEHHMDGMEMGHDHDHDHMMGHSDEMAEDNLSQGKGVLNAVDVKGHKINISHEAIPALHWPAMTMDIPVAPSIDLSHLEKGDHVTFSLELEDNAYVIEDLKKE